MLLTKENIKTNVPNICGIYLIRNTVNNKCYIGQSIYLQKRLLKHITPKTWEHQKDRMLIYKAFEKYGLEAFEFEILEEIDSTDYSIVKPRLDSLEKEYILQYNSKTEGYNQTNGGDAGITGYKFSKEQIKYQSQKRLETIKRTWQYEVRCYDTLTQHMHFAQSIPELNKLLDIHFNTEDLRNILVRGRYIIANSGKELTEKSKKYFEIRDKITHK